MCDCYQIGGPFIAEDPDCPIHGERSHNREERLLVIMEQVRDGILTAEQGVSAVEEEYY